MQIVSWKLIDKYFKDNPYNLVSHHLDSYNDFFDKDIYNIFRENNPVRFSERKEKGDEQQSEDQPSECMLYLGGKSGTKLYFGKPIIYDDTDGDGLTDPYAHYMYPNNARLRNMTYGVSIHYDVEVDYIYYKNGEKQTHTSLLEKIYLGRFPIMVQSNLCILKGLTPEARYNLGECRNDLGGYFIIDGHEKVILSQEKFGDNMIYVKKNRNGDPYSYSCEVHSVSEDTSKQIRYTAVRMMAAKYSATDGSLTQTNGQLVVDVPNVKQPVPLFILMRALGVISDKSIIEYCLLNLDANSDLLELFVPSIHDANIVYTQETALEYIKTFTKRQTINYVQDILMNYFLPHIGENNYLDKAYYIGYMVHNLLLVSSGRAKPTDRDNFKFKRVEISGTLIHNLFREYFLIQNNTIRRKIDEEFYFHKMRYRENFVSLVDGNVSEIFKERIVEDGISKGFKGNWGASSNTKKTGIVQPLDRLSWFSFMSHLRKIILPLDSTAKVVGPHLLHNTQWGIIDPVDTPDGGNIGLHKYLAISSKVTRHYSATPMIKFLRQNTSLKLLQECNPNYMFMSTKVIVNGNWVGVIGNWNDKENETPMSYVAILKLFRRNGVIPVYTSISFDYSANTVYIYTDGGRLTRPIFYRNIDGNISYESADEYILSGNFTWSQVVSGFYNKSGDPNFNIQNNEFYSYKQLYPDISSQDELVKIFETNKAIIDYVDVSEEEMCYIANTPDQLAANPQYTHAEIDPSLMFGIMGNSIIFPEYNQFPRDVFSCGQSRQATSVYHSNYQVRLDKTGIILNYGQIPLVKSRYLEYINNEQHPYGVNAMVAIMSYTGYNVEDAILINEGSINRGMFKTSYYTTYEEKEESSTVSKTDVDAVFGNIESKKSVDRLKLGYDYSQLDEAGLIKENTLIDEDTILIGKMSYQIQNKNVYTDASKATKKGQRGYVDKTYMSNDKEGFRIAKVRICEDRSPNIGDKMASRSGQKGTVGLIIPEADMPFTADGVRPDLIINPHALPSRMTIGQLIESLLGKAAAVYGGYGDCTAYATKGSNYSTYGHMLTKAGYHNTGNQLMYNGFTGEQIYSEIYIGPTYYMRLKHMVKDKINYRARGPKTSLTRQTVQGRANDGGLRIGEMERDGILGHGMSGFLNESYLVRGDEYYMAVCNTTGTIAIYNPVQNLFLSPSADGPLKFKPSINDSNKQILDTVNALGRTFSIVKIPYTFKLLIQELQVMNIQMRIITNDNIDQFMNLSYKSGTVEKMLCNPDKQGEYEECVDTWDLERLIDGYVQTVKRIKYKADKNIEKENKREAAIMKIEQEEEQETNAEEKAFDEESGAVAANPYDTINDQKDAFYYADDMNTIPQSNTILAPELPIGENKIGGEVTEYDGANDDGLGIYFNALPQHDQLDALHATYKQKADEFDKLSEELKKQISEKTNENELGAEFTPINNDSNVIFDKNVIKILKPDDGDKKDANEDSGNDNNVESSSSSSSNSDNNLGNTKKIVMSV